MQTLPKHINKNPQAISQRARAATPVHPHFEKAILTLEWLCTITQLFSTPEDSSTKEKK